MSRVQSKERKGVGVMNGGVVYLSIQGWSVSQHQEARWVLLACVLHIDFVCVVVCAVGLFGTAGVGARGGRGVLVVGARSGPTRVVPPLSLELCALLLRPRKL